MSDETKEEKEITEGANLLVPDKLTYFDDDFRHLYDSKKENYDYPTLLVPKLDIGYLGGPNAPMYEKQEMYVQKFNFHSEDPVRTNLGKIWVHSNNQGLVFFKELTDPNFNGVTPLKDYHISTYAMGSTAAMGAGVFIRKEMLTINYDGPLQAEKNAQMYTRIKNQAQVGSVKYHVDFTSEHTMPYKYEELEDISNAIGTKAAYVKTDSTYNYHIPAYENLISTPGKFKFPPDFYNSDGLEDFIEKILPDIQTGIVDNVSADMSQAVNSQGFKVTTSNILLTDLHLTLADYIQGMFKNSLTDKGKLKRNVNKPKFGSKNGADVENEGRYFEIWTKVVKKILEKSPEIATSPAALSRVMKLFRIYKTKILPATTVPLLNEYNGRKYLYPMFNEIEFSTDTKTRLADLLSEFNLGYSVLKSIRQGINGDLQDFPSTTARGNIDFQLSDSAYVTSKDKIMVYGPSREFAEKVGRELFSFRFLDTSNDDWIDGYLKPNYDFYAYVDSDKYKIAGSWPFTDHALLLKPDSYPIQSPPNSVELQMTDLDNIDNKLFKTIYTTVFKKRLQALIQEKTRSFEDILNGKKAYTETIAYRIEKWSVKDEQPDELIQDVLLQNTSEIDVLNYVDTQVRYETPYIYKIYSWNAIFGTQYRYALASPDPNDMQPEEASQSNNSITGMMDAIQNVDVEAQEQEGKLLEDVYRRAAHLLVADLAQRLWFKKSLPSSYTTGDSDIPPWQLSPADLELLDTIACGAPVDYENNFPVGFTGGSMQCTHSNASSYSLPGVNNMAGCCTKYNDSDLNTFENELFSLYCDHMDNALGKSGDKFKFSYEDAHFSVDYKNYGNGDPYQDIFSATLNSIIARRVSWMIENGVTIEATADNNTSFTTAGVSGGFADGQQFPSWSKNKGWTGQLDALSNRWDAIRNIVGTVDSPWYDNTRVNKKFNVGQESNTGLFGIVSDNFAESKLEQVGNFPDKSLSFDIPFVDAYKFLMAFDLMKCKPYTRVLEPDTVLGYNLGSSGDEATFYTLFNKALMQYVAAVEKYIEFKNPAPAPTPPADPPQEQQQLAESGTTSIKVISKPIVKVVEIPYFTTPVMSVEDSNPLYPNVDIIPYKGHNNKILINLNSNTGEISEPPNLFTEKGMKKLYKKEYGENWESKRIEFAPITFKGDDAPKEFIIRKRDTRPSSIVDFKRANSNEIVLPSNGYSATSFVDNIVPNKKYWYGFRTQDVHNNWSNIGPIYQVEMVDTDGAIYLLVEVIEPKAKVEKIKTKSARRYLQVQPTVRHTLLNEEKTFGEDIENKNVVSAIGKKPALGDASPSLFDAGETQKFKIRLTSKDTGKKIDLNVRFVHQHEKTPTEESNDENTNLDPENANG